MSRLVRSLVVAFVLLLVAAACSSPDEEPTTPEFKNARALYNQDSVEKALPLFEQAAEAAPENGVARAWLATAHEEVGNREQAEAAAREALATSRCNPIAHTVLGTLYNPQYGWDKAHADSAWTHARRAVECNEADGNAWLTLWTLSVRRGRPDLARKAMRRLHETDFIPPTMQAVARWQLRTLPDSALFLTNGDWDTYPPLAVQVAEGIRTDVAVVNFNMLNLPAYADRMIETHDLPRPMSARELEAFTPRRDERGRPVALADELLRRWSARVEAGSMDRPLILAPTIRTDALRKNVPERVANVGPYYRISPTPDEVPLDTTRILGGFRQTDGTEFVGPVVHPDDRSAGRQTTDSTVFSRVVLGSGIRYGHKLHAADHETAAREMVAWAEAFWSNAAVSEEGADRYEARLRSLKRQLEGQASPPSLPDRP